MFKVFDGTPLFMHLNKSFVNAKFSDFFLFNRISVTTFFQKNALTSKNYVYEPSINILNFPVKVNFLVTVFCLGWKIVFIVSLSLIEPSVSNHLQKICYKNRQKVFQVWQKHCSLILLIMLIFDHFSSGGDFLWLFWKY